MFARDSSVSLTAASFSVEEPKEKSPLIEEMPDRAEELFLPSSKGAGLAIIPLSANADIPLFKGDFLKNWFMCLKKVHRRGEHRSPVILPMFLETLS